MTGQQAPPFAPIQWIDIEAEAVFVRGQLNETSLSEDFERSMILRARLNLSKGAHLYAIYISLIGN